MAERKEDTPVHAGSPDEPTVVATGAGDTPAPEAPSTPGTPAAGTTDRRGGAVQERAGAQGASTAARAQKDRLRRGSDQGASTAARAQKDRLRRGSDQGASAAAPSTSTGREPLPTGRPATTGTRATGRLTTPTRTTTPLSNRPVHKPVRHAGPIPTRTGHRRYWFTLGGLVLAGLLFSWLNLAWDNPMPVGSEGFWKIAQLRAENVVIVVVVAFCQGVATVAFQTATNNRIITPSIMGFESLYSLVQTAAVFVFGATGVVLAQGPVQFVFQVFLMVGASALLYGWLLTGKRGNIQVMLLVGIVIGGGLGSITTFMQRLLTPSDFDVLTARLIGSIANADSTYLFIGLPFVALAGGALWISSTRLNVLALGRDTAMNLGVNYRRQTMLVLLCVSVLMAISTSLVGPMTFLGFLVAMIAYQLADTHDHRYVFPMAWAVGVVLLAGSYFVLKHVFYAEGSVGIIIELVGGTFFLVYVLRKGRL
ncbi:iron chelate uptake ABC transporter family permease subunit [Brevibacterium litoralis]|uniref:iron chelate uptake ABC transporter family permease subunit n=1 Tax=Brevibacterium litoralis TaxID=3138935 RepID=UPI0032EB9A96